jgi:RNA polymerase sigma-70 factor (ECF subfamily)
MIAPNDLAKLIHKIAIDDDSIAYKELFILYHQKLVTFSLSIIQSRELAEEVVSDVFLKIWLNRNTLSRIENFHLYIYVITKNTSLNYLLKYKREKNFSLDNVTVELKSIQWDPEQMLITAEMYRRILKAIHELPPKCRLIFKLVKEDGLKYKEVAELLSLSVKTVESQMAIALKKLAHSIRFHLIKSTLN